jgi:hypothetical protein
VINDRKQAEEVAEVMREDLGNIEPEGQASGFSEELHTEYGS